VKQNKIISPNFSKMRFRKKILHIVVFDVKFSLYNFSPCKNLKIYKN